MLWMRFLPYDYHCHPCPFQPPVLPLTLTHTMLILLRLFSLIMIYRGSSLHIPTSKSLSISAAWVILKKLSKSNALCNISKHVSVFAVSRFYPLVQPSNWWTTPYQLCVLTYSIHLQLSHLEAVPSNLNLKTHHAVVTRGPLNLYWYLIFYILKLKNEYSKTACS
jgi:hypothetical protein